MTNRSDVAHALLRAASALLPTPSVPTSACPTYIELHARSAFSFLEGSSTPEELVSRAAELNLPALAVLDRDNVSGAPRFHSMRAAIEQHVCIHCGTPFRPTAHRPRA